MPAADFTGHTFKFTQENGLQIQAKTNSTTSFIQVKKKIEHNLNYLTHFGLGNTEPQLHIQIRNGEI